MKRSVSATMQEVSPSGKKPPVFKRSFLLVMIVVTLVFASAFAAQMYMMRELPSSYDSGLTIEKAFKSSKVPLLIEFYSDTCNTCRRMAPMIHELYETHYKQRLTVVMMDVSDPGNQDIARLFGVDSLPALYIFDHHRMKKYRIRSEDFSSKGTLQQAIDEALSKTLLRLES